MRLEATERTPNGPETSTSSAIAKGYFKQVRYLLEMGHPPNARLPDGRTPLILCALVKNSPWRSGLARTLLEKGARVGLADRSGLNALHYAAIYECADLVDIFLAAADFDLNAADKFGNSALFYAAHAGNETIVEALVAALGRYCLPMDRANRAGLTPLMAAWRGDHRACAERLLAAGADPDRSDAFGKACRAYARECKAREDAKEAAAEAKRQRAAIRFDDVAAWRRHQARARSAPPAGPRALGAGPWRQAEEERRRRTALVTRDETLAIAEASPFDSRNDPNTVFQATAAEFFGRYQRMRKTSRPPRPRTAHPSHPRRVRRSDPPEGVEAGEGGADEGWKEGVPGLYRHLEVQCSASYRQSAKPAEPEDAEARAPGTYASGLGGKVGNSPMGSETASEVTDRSRGSRKGGSVAGSRSAAGAKGGRVRKTSTTSRMQSMESLMEDGATAGSDSVSLSGVRMRGKMSLITGLPPRPVSRASHAKMNVREAPTP